MGLNVTITIALNDLSNFQRENKYERMLCSYVEFKTHAKINFIEIISLQIMKTKDLIFLPIFMCA